MIQVSENNINEKNISNLYKNFSKVDYSSARNYMQNAYGKHVEYHTKEDFIRETKRKSTYKTSIIAATIIGTFAIAFSLLRRRIDTKIIKNGLHLAQSATKEPVIKISNAMANIVNIKDDIWNKFINNEKLNKIPGFGILNKIANAVTGIDKHFTKISPLGKEYKQAYNEVIKAGGSYRDFENYDSFFENIDKKTISGLKKNHVTDNLINGEFFDKFFNGVIADDIISKNSHNIATEVPINPEWSEELKNKALKYNKQRAKTYGLLAPKLRDLNCGSAPTDLLTIVLSGLGLGIAAANADSKEERKSTVINLGIPLITTLLSTKIGALLAYSGAKSLLFGLAAGQVASNTARVIDNNLKKSNKKT